MSAFCESCRARMIWAESGTSGKRMPLDFTSVPMGTPGSFVVLGGIAYSEDGAVSETSLRGAISMARAREILDGHDWHLSHFASCPNRDQHRKARR